MRSSGLAEAKSAVVTLNVSGLRFQTFATSLERFPKTLLGSPLKRSLHLNPDTGELFFDRHRGSFKAILYLYQSGGNLRRPARVPLDVFLGELKFFEMDGEIMERFWETEGYVKPAEIPLPRNILQRTLWQLLEYPDTSFGARIVAFFSVFVIAVSIASFCLETVPSLKYHRSNVTQDFNEAGEAVPIEKDTFDWDNPFFCVEISCILWFTVEFLLRFLCSPEKLLFIRSFLNIIDVVAITPFYVNLVWSNSGGAMSFAVLRVLRLVRVFRIFKLSRHSVGLQVLGKTFAASVHELCLLLFFMAIVLILFSSAVYFAEHGVTGTEFSSIPTAFWYTIVTMTTVGYGDLVPRGPLGKVVGSLCAVVGVLVLALPVPVIVANFKHFYRQETQLAAITRLLQEGELLKDDQQRLSESSED